MHVKENDQIPNTDIFVIEDGKAVKKKYSNIFKG